ncbi:MAG TPA: hypothetical protein VE476_01035, partial [Propionibacteriaceae bacterium]|nr:hypothetical protein [Propionibacteriaceae bacterium]
MSVTFSALDTTTDQWVADELSVNMANANAAVVLDALGFAEDVAAGDLCGGIPAQDFLGRVLTGFGLAPTDPGRPATEDIGEHGARFIDCGRAPGYVQ